MHSAAGPLLMHAVDCLEFSFLFFFFSPYRAVGCYCLWIWLAIGHDVRLPPGTLRVAWGRESCSVAKLNPQKKELRL